VTPSSQIVACTSSCAQHDGAAAAAGDGAAPTPRRGLCRCWLLLMRGQAAQTQDSLAAVSSQARGLRSAVCQFATQQAARDQQLHGRVAHACSVAVQRRAGVRCCWCGCHLVLHLCEARAADGGCALHRWFCVAVCVAHQQRNCCIWAVHVTSCISAIETVPC
jgi:hypothetical protein